MYRSRPWHHPLIYSSLEFLVSTVELCHKIISLLEIVQLLLPPLLLLGTARREILPKYNRSRYWTLNSRILPPLVYRYLIDYKDRPQNASRSGTRLDKIPLIPHLCLQSLINNLLTLWDSPSSPNQCLRFRNTARFSLHNLHDASLDAPYPNKLATPNRSVTLTGQELGSKLCSGRMDEERAWGFHTRNHLAKVYNVVADVLTTSAISDCNSFLSLSLKMPCITFLVITWAATLTNT
jgi:hypothetical protein